MTDAWPDGTGRAGSAGSDTPQSIPRAIDEIVLATRNVGKAAELRTLLAPLSATLVDLDAAGIAPDPAEDAIEDGETFEANALAKARYFAARSGGRPVIADDSGLCVAALGGAPGVRSRRYAGAVGTEAEVSGANSRHLLEAMRSISDRRAAFVCALAYCGTGRELVVLAQSSGQILEQATGVEGFGYDPLFWSDDLQRSFGEASRDEKAQVSHRARAALELMHRLGRPWH